MAPVMRLIPALRTSFARLPIEVRGRFPRRAKRALARAGSPAPTITRLPRIVCPRRAPGRRVYSLVFSRPSAPKRSSAAPVVNSFVFEASTRRVREAQLNRMRLRGASMSITHAPLAPPARCIWLVSS